MEMIFSVACLAMSSTPPGTESTAPSWVPMIPILAVFALMYFVMIKPQQRQQQEHQKLVNTLKGGDQVILNSGIYGSIVDVKEQTLTVKIADNVRIKVLRTAVQQVVNGEKSEKGEKDKAVAGKA